ncbi:marine proteobacterial sortase target protein [Haliea sp. E17]|uniref:marine proteobacterial sortase target protein n=1 Tax=Haliea sp. E17 TaxID=3401576 RepID=UPI003AB0AC3C
MECSIMARAKSGAVSPVRASGLVRYCLVVAIACVSIAQVSATTVAGDTSLPESAGSFRDYSRPVEEGAGAILWHDSASGAFTPALTQETRVRMQITGMVAIVEMEQRFENQTGLWQEGIYTFPLPTDAAVRRLEMQVGDRLVLGRIRERQAAAAAYQAAKSEGKKAALVEQQRPNLFTNRIANIGPGESVTVRLEYVQLASFDGGEFSLRVPTTLTPRYIPGTPIDSHPEGGTLLLDNASGWAIPTDQVPDAAAITPYHYPREGSDRDPLNPVRFDILLDAGMPLASVEALYHRVRLSRDGERYQLELADGVSEMDRDFALHWRPVSGTSPRAALFTERVGEDYYGLLMIVPPALAKAASVLPRDLVFVIDTSGSMGGESIRQAKSGLRKGLAQLRPEDRFNIIAFDSNIRALYRSPQAASPHRLAQAGEFVRHLDASGGTEMLPALALALAPEGDGEPSPAAPPRIRQVIFITDGAVGNEQALFDAIQRQLGDSRLFTVGIGTAPNHWFMQRAAAAGRGFSVQVSQADEVDTQIDELFQRINSPLAAGLKVHWPTTSDAWPARVPDLYRGEPLVQAVHFGRQLPTGSVTVSGTLAGEGWRQQIPFPAQAESGAGIGSVWARRKIAVLLALRSAGEDEEKVRQQVLEVALTHQLLSPYTSFVAIEEQVSRPASALLRKGALPNTRPAGQAPQPYAYPRTATSARANVLLGSMCLFIALLVYVLRRPEADRHAPAH